MTDKEQYLKFENTKASLSKPYLGTTNVFSKSANSI